MARKFRVQYPGAIYHAMNRGDRREAIFSDDQDRHCFLETLAEACQKTDWQVHAWCLMHNRFHLVVETPRANLVGGMKWLLGEWGIPQDSPAGREQFALRLEVRRQAEAEPGFDPYKQGWCLGSEQFREELLAQVSELASPLHRGPEVSGSAVAKARRIVETELEGLGWTARDLQARRKGDRQKVRIAARLRQETTMTLAWIAEQLHMGAPSHLACLLYRAEKKGSNEPEIENTLF